MPDLDTSIHLDMLREFRKDNSRPRRLWKAITGALRSKDLYGLQWGDPELVAPLRFVRDTYLTPYVRRDHAAVEIGPGGGRWTRYLIGFGELFVVDVHAELIAEIKKNFDQPNMRFVLNDGTDFPGIPDRSIQFLFSFGTFVHLDLPLIETYVDNMRRILTDDANVVIQYADKTKIMGRRADTFAENDPDAMRRLVTGAGYQIAEEDLTTLWHSSIVRFTPRSEG